MMIRTLLASMPGGDTLIRSRQRRLSSRLEELQSMARIRTDLQATHLHDHDGEDEMQGQTEGRTDDEASSPRLKRLLSSSNPVRSLSLSRPIFDVADHHPLPGVYSNPNLPTLSQLQSPSPNPWPSSGKPSNVSASLSPKESEQKKPKDVKRLDLYYTLHWHLRVSRGYKILCSFALYLMFPLFVSFEYPIRRLADTLGICYAQVSARFRFRRRRRRRREGGRVSGRRSRRRTT